MVAVIAGLFAAWLDCKLTGQNILDKASDIAFYRADQVDFGIVKSDTTGLLAGRNAQIAAALHKRTWLYDPTEGHAIDRQLHIATGQGFIDFNRSGARF